MGKFKLAIPESPYFATSNYCEVGTNFTNFYEAGLLKLDMFDK
jgi:hypothetical protein